MKVELYLSIGYANANREETIFIPDDVAEGMTEKEIEEYLDEYLEDWANNYIETGYRIKQQQKG